MMGNMERVGIKKDLQYECITTTISAEKEKNAGVFAFKYLGEDKVFCRIFEGSKTLKNIIDTKEYVVNITQDPLAFSKSTLKTFDETFFTSDEDMAILKDTPAYLIVDVLSIEEKTPDDFPIPGDNKIYFITGKVRQFNQTAPVLAFNMGFSGLIEGLVNFSRYKVVGAEKRKYYMDRLVENQRVINKVSDEKTQKAMEMLKKEYEKN